MKYIVYKTTNLINGKIYVGVHKTNPDIFDGYIGCGINHKDKKKSRTKGFPAAVRKYGYENFKREILAIFPYTQEGHDDAYRMEGEIVNEEFVRSKNTYNLVLGGRFTLYENLKKEIAQYTMDGKFIRTWSSITEASEALNLTSINNCLIGNAKYCGNFQWRYYTNEDDIPPVEPKEKGVYQFDLSGNLLKVWKSAAEAAKEFENFEAAKTAIWNVCNNKVRQAYGYYWNYTNKFEYNEYIQTKAVAKYDEEGNFIESYSSIKEAAAAHGLKSSTSIINNIKGKQKRAVGFRWRYFYGNTCNIKSL